MIESLPTISELRKLISKFKYSDLENTSIDEYKHQFDKIIQFFSFPAFYYSAGTKLHRMRINPNGEEFMNLSELWCPPKNLIVKYGRLNNKEEQILYTAGGGHTCLREIDPKPGTIITCAEFEIVENLLVIEIGLFNRYIREKEFQQLWNKFSKQLIRYYRNNHKLIVLDRELKKFIADEFTKKIEPGQEDLYKRTIAMANVFLSNPDLDGILYPSTKADFQEINLALPIDVAYKKLKPKRIDVLEILPGEPRTFKSLKGCYENIDFDNSLVYTESRKITGWAYFIPKPYPRKS
jgi:hypothetical protein